MAKALLRSRSLKLRSPRTDDSARGTENVQPVTSGTALLHPPNVFGGNVKATAAAARPSTAGGPQRPRAGVSPQRYSPMAGNNVKNDFASSPRVLWAAEIHSTAVHSARSVPSASPNTAAHQQTRVLASSQRIDSPLMSARSEGIDDPSRPRMHRWKSLRGIFGGKRPNVDQSSGLTPPFGDFSGLQSPSVGPTRAETSPMMMTRDGTVPMLTTRSETAPMLTTRTWSEPSRKTVLRLDKPLPPIVPSQCTPPLSPANQEEDQGFHGGHKYRGGTTTRPMLDVEIPESDMERYSVMFGGLLRSNTQPSLLSRRQQGRASKRNPLQVDAPKPPFAADTSLKPEISTPRTQARYQLSLFPPASPRSAPMLNPLRMHQPRKLQRSESSPVPRSPMSLLLPRFHSNASKTFSTVSQDVPIRLEVTTESAYLAPAPLNITKPSPLSIRNSDVMLMAATPSTAGSSRFSFISDDVDGDAVGEGSLRPLSREPAWEMVTPPRSDSLSAPPTAVPTRPEFPTRVDSATLPAKPLSARSQEPPIVQVAVARQLSVTKARSTKKYLEPKPLQIKNGLSTERLVDRKPLTPTLVESTTRDGRKSQAVQIEGL